MGKGLQTGSADLFCSTLQEKGRKGLHGDKTCCPPRVLHSFQAVLAEHSREKPSVPRSRVGRCVQERKGELRELLAPNLNQHQKKTAKNTNVNNSVTLTSYLVFDKSGPPSRPEGRVG